MSSTSTSQITIPASSSSQPNDLQAQAWQQKVLADASKPKSPAQISSDEQQPRV